MEIITINDEENNNDFLTKKRKRNKMKKENKNNKENKRMQKIKEIIEMKKLIEKEKIEEIKESINKEKYKNNLNIAKKFDKKEKKDNSIYLSVSYSFSNQINYSNIYENNNDYRCSSDNVSSFLNNYNSSERQFS